MDVDLPSSVLLLHSDEVEPQWNHRRSDCGAAHLVGRGPGRGPRAEPGSWPRGWCLEQAGREAASEGWQAGRRQLPCH